MWPLADWVAQLKQFDQYLRNPQTHWSQLPFDSADDQCLFRDQDQLVLMTVKTLQRLARFRISDPHLHWYTYVLTLKFTNDSQVSTIYQCIEQVYSIHGVLENCEDMEYFLMHLLDFDMVHLTKVI